MLFPWQLLSLLAHYHEVAELVEGLEEYIKESIGETAIRVHLQQRKFLVLLCMVYARN